MKMMDMKMPKKSNKEEAGISVSSSKDEYPYGLRITLNNEELSKLGIDGDVGDEVEIEAIGTITNKSENSQQGGKTEKRLEIQIKKLSCICGSETEYTDDKTTTAKRIAISRLRKGQ